MFSAEAALDTTLLDQLQQAARTFPEAIERFAKRDLRPFVSQQIDKTLRREPGPVKYPIEWTSEKQRRYVLAKLRREDNLPYRRTHGYIHSWHVQGDYANGLSSITVFSDAQIAEFVGGRRQQRFHQNTGWPNAASTLQMISVDLNERIEVGLPSVIADALGGR